MCGIAGFIDFKKNTNPGVLQQMTNSIVHRGPDGSGYLLLDCSDALIGLGHRRLAIIDLTENGSQPMTFADYHLVFNGEIYNFQEIKDELIALGHTFQSQSDTEMILHAYRQWGSSCLNKFVGMFAIVLVDLKENKVFAARDRAGVKPLFYYNKDGLFLFASELKAFHEHPGFEKQIDSNAVAEFLQYGSVPAPSCIFQDCFKLKPAHWMELDLSSGKLKNQAYWSVYNAYNQPKLTISLEEATDETEKILQTAFEYRMVSDVPVGVFLSGGYDSASVAAILQKNRTDKLKTYTIAVPSIGLNEAPYAAEVAGFLGTEHTEINCTQQDALELITDLPYYYDEPFGDSSAIPTMLVSKMAGRHVTVVLSADAGDEVFAGYNRYDYLMRYGNMMNRIPAFARKMMAETMERIPADRIPILRDKYNFPNRYEKLKGILRNPSPEQIMLSLSQQWNDQLLKSVVKFNPEFRKTAYQSDQLSGETFSPLAYMMAIDYETYLPDDILQKVDRATMAASIEGREPFLDHRVIEWAATLPDSFKYHDGEKKFILKEIVHRYIPKELMDRPKMGFAIPVADWLQHELRELVDNYLNEQDIRSQGILNWDYVSVLKQQFYSGKKELHVKIWYILMFQMWYKRWM